MKKAVMLLILELILVGVAGQAQATSSTLVYNTSSVLEGTRYDFTLTNNDQDPFISELFLHLPIDYTDLVSFGSPAGWGDGFGGSTPNNGVDTPDGTSFIEWFADTGFELPKGNSLSGFSFVSDKAVQDQMTFSLNQDINIIGTAVVTPEPVSGVLFGLGGVAIAFARRRMKVNS